MFSCSTSFERRRVESLMSDFWPRVEGKGKGQQVCCVDSEAAPAIGVFCGTK